MVIVPPNHGRITIRPYVRCTLWNDALIVPQCECTDCAALSRSVLSIVQIFEQRRKRNNHRSGSKISDGMDNVKG